MSAPNKRRKTAPEDEAMGSSSGAGSTPARDAEDVDAVVESDVTGAAGSARSFGAPTGGGALGKRSRDDISKASVARFLKCGQIKSVVCYNLRCQENMRVDFSPGTTFIVGQNGSGKSTVAIGIQIGLGMRPLRIGLVRKDALGSTPEAVVTLELHNDGEKAFKHGKYGDSIIIKRKITYNKDLDKYTSDRIETYGFPRDKPKDKPTPVCTNNAEARQEVIDMCAEFGLAANNPVMILDQEGAKTFLTGDPGIQYQYFLRATGLQEEFEQIAEFRRELRQTKAVITHEETQLKETESKLSIAKVQYEKVKSLGELQKKIKTVEMAELWADVEQYEGEIETKTAAHATQCANVLKGVQAIAIMNAKLDAAREAQESVRSKVEEIQQAQIEHKERIAAATEELEEALAPHAAQQLEVKRCVDVLEKAKKALATKESALSNLRAQVAKRKTVGKGPTKASTVERAEADKATAEEELVQAIAQEKKADAAESEAVKALRGAQQELTYLDAEANGKQNEVNLLSKMKDSELNDPLLNYRTKQNTATNFAVRIADLVTREKARFVQPVLGPVASLVRVNNPEWVKSIEAACTVLHTFISSTSQDSKTLEMLTKNDRDRKSLNYVERRDKARYARKPCPVGGVSALDIMEIEDDKAYNLMLDSTKIDSLLLLSDQAHAKAALAKFNGCTLITRDCFKFKTTGVSGFTQQAMSTENASPFFRGPKVVDKTAQLAKAKADAEQARKDAQDGRMSLKKFEAEAASASQGAEYERKNLRRKEADLQAASKRLTAAYNMPEDAVVKDDDDDAVVIAEGEDAVTRARDALNSAMAKVDAAKAKLASMNGSVDAAKKKLTALAKGDADAEIRAAMAEVEVSNASVERLEVMLNKAEGMKKDADESLAKAMAAKEAAEVKHKTVYEAASNATGQTEQHADFKKKTRIELGAIREALKKQQKQDEARFGGEGAFLKAEAAYQSAQRDYARESKHLMEVKQNVTKLDAAYKSSRTRFHEHQGLYSKSVSDRFHELCMKKGHAGTVSFEHALNGDLDKGTISVHLIPDAVSRKMHTLDPKEVGKEVGALSGGEKSFTSLILLSAIARVAQPPFRIIDEFDVFQDEATRRLSMQLLLEDANPKAQDPAQYILLTPHDISSGIQGGDQLIKEGLLKVFRMEAPKRS